VDAPFFNYNVPNEWISECHSKHKDSCEEAQATVARVLGKNPSMILIDLERQCLIQDTEGKEYVCLSYVWGPSKNPFRATKSNFAELLSTDSLRRNQHRLPQTIRDAMTVAANLSFNYLWVDRLCILQDDPLILDDQIAYMASTYALAAFTIVASYGSDDNTGIPGVSLPRSISRSTYRFGHSAVFTRYNNDWSEDRDVWHSRAWTFQERLISSRCIVFYRGTMKWECGHHTRHELFDGMQSEPKLRVDMRSWPDVQQYTDCVRAYTARNLTYQEDVIKAFSAVTRFFEPSFPDGMLWGVPEFVFDSCLTWRSGALQVRRPGFPSWSWIGWIGAMQPGWPGICDWEPTYPRIRQDPYISRPLVGWRKKRNSSSVGVAVKSSDAYWQSFRGDLFSALPSGWMRLPESEAYQHETFSHKELGIASGSRFWHPVPINPIGVHRFTQGTQPWGPKLYGKAQIVTLISGDSFTQEFAYHNALIHHGMFLGPRSRSDMPLSFDLLDATLGWCGTILSNSLTSDSYIRGALCELVAISEGTCFLMNSEGWDQNLAYKTTGYTNGPIQVTNVIWICWDNGVAYRHGIGRIWKKQWDLLSPVTKEIVLG